MKLTKKKATSYVVDILVNCKGDMRETQKDSAELLAPSAEGGIPQVVPIRLSQIDAFSSVRVYVPKVTWGSLWRCSLSFKERSCHDLYGPQELMSIESRRVALRTLSEVERRFPKVIPGLSSYIVTSYRTN